MASSTDSQTFDSHPCEDFPALISEPKRCSFEDAGQHLDRWNKEFERLWTGESEKWTALVDLLPLVPADSSDQVQMADFPSHLVSEEYALLASDLFLCQPLIAAHLSNFIWTECVGSPAVSFVAGCINLARISRRMPRPMNAIDDAISAVLRHYVFTLAALGIEHPDLLASDSNGCRVAEAIQLPHDTLLHLPWVNNFSKENICSLLDRFGHQPLLQALRDLLQQEDIPRNVLVAMLRAAAEQLSSNPHRAHRCREFLMAFSFDDPTFSSLCRDLYRKCAGHERKEGLSLWSRYVAIGDAFPLCWESVRPARDSNQEPPLGKDLEGRLEAFAGLLSTPDCYGGSAEPPNPSGRHWRCGAVRLFCILGSLAELRWGNREEQWVRQEEAVAVLTEYPELIVGTIRGILEDCQEYWNAFDPIILGLPAALSVPPLTDRLEESPAWSEARHHARRPLSHAKGETVPGTPKESTFSLLAAAETLIDCTRTRVPRATAMTWLGDPGIESLWHAAIEVGQREFDQYLATQYGQEEHEHCAILADALARALNSTNATVQKWLQGQALQPSFIRVAVRRIPRRSKATAQEGGARGLHADLGLLLKCEVAGKCIARRITLIQAKKLAPPEPGNAWPGEFKLQPKERNQLRALLAVSGCAHYLFLLPCELGCTVALSPAKLVRDILAARGPVGGVPVPTVLGAGIRLSDFLLWHVIGLWTGDDDEAIITKAESGDEYFQGPRLMVEVTVSREGRADVR